MASSALTDFSSLWAFEVKTPNVHRLPKSVQDCPLQVCMKRIPLLESSRRRNPPVGCMWMFTTAIPEPRKWRQKGDFSVILGYIRNSGSDWAVGDPVSKQAKRQTMTTKINQRARCSFFFSLFWDRVLLCRPSEFWTQYPSSCLSLSSAEVTGIRHHIQPWGVISFRKITHCLK